MAGSYNELFGLGSHSEDASITGWWLMQDDASTSVVVDSSSNANNGTFYNGLNSYTSENSSTGPTGWLPKCLDYSLSSAAVSVPNGVLGASAGGAKTMIVRFKTLPAFLDTDYVLGTGFSTNNRYYIFYDASGNFKCRVGSSGNLGSATLTANTWYEVAVVFGDGGSNQVRSYVNATNDVNTSVSTPGGAVDDIVIGAQSTSRGNGIGSPLSVSSSFERALTSTEIAESYNGPELIYSTGASLGDDGAYSVGTWGLDSPFSGLANGTATYAWVIANAAGSVVDSGSGSSGTADLSSEAGNTVYFLVRASNTGGYDIGDKATRTSAYGSSGDGYYEVASVVAAGGGTESGAGTSSGTASASGVGASTASSTGTASGLATASGIAAAASPSAGTSTGIAVATGVGASTAASVGSSDGLATATAVGASTFASVGSSAGSATANAIADLAGSAIGSANGFAIANAVGASVWLAVGTSSGTSTATATYGNVASGAGSASGSATVSGIGALVAAAIASANGIATALAVSEATITSVGSAAGTSSVTAVSVGGATYIRVSSSYISVPKATGTIVA